MHGGEARPPSSIISKGATEGVRQLIAYAKANPDWLSPYLLSITQTPFQSSPGGFTPR